MKTFLALTLFSFLSALLPAAEVRHVSPSEAAQRVAAGQAILVDVREPKEWAETGVAAPAVLLPKSDFDGDQKLWKPFLESVSDKEVIVYCRLGRRAGTIAQALTERGLKTANAGGFKEWTDAGLPVRKASDQPPSSK